jgi:hypothetical protein
MTFTTPAAALMLGFCALVLLAAARAMFKR